ncbi:MAG: DUF547 domain-containing protein [Bacteroidota bacterium]
MKTYLLVGFTILLGCNATAQPADVPAERVTAFDHSVWTELLEAHVRDGLVDYVAFQDNPKLAAYLDALARTDPSGLSRDEQLAFWINAYNAQVIDLIQRHYPATSILKLTPIKVPGVNAHVPYINDVFKTQGGLVAGTFRTLDEIEHQIIRPTFNESRIHFALNCAAISCPSLRAEAFVGSRLDAQLEEQTQSFLLDTDQNNFDVAERTAHVTKLMDWFAEDFGGNETAIQAFLAPYFSGFIQAALRDGKFKLKYQDYDWDLNDLNQR